MTAPSFHIKAGAFGGAPASAFSATIDWGDGTTSAGTVRGSDGVYDVVGCHTYVQPGPYPIGVTITDPGGAQVEPSYGNSGEVADPPVYTVAQILSNYNGYAQGTGGYVASIDWGDGTQSGGIITPEQYSYLVSSPHSYAQDGFYTVVTTVTSAEGVVETCSQGIYAATAPMQADGRPTVYDGAGPTLTASQPSPPSIYPLQDQTNAEGDGPSLQVYATDPNVSAANPYGYALTYDAVSLPAGLTINHTTGLISGTVQYGAADAFGGAYPVTVVVADSGGASSSETFNWTITPTVQAPVFSSTLGSQTGYAGDTVDVQADAAQPEGDQVVYDESGLPDGLSIDSLSGAITGAIAADASANNDVTLTATDQGQTATESFDWAVNVQHDPTLTSPGDQANAVGDKVDVALTEDDAPGNTPTYVVTGLPDGLGYDSGSGEITGVLASDAAGAAPHQVTATVSDGGASASTTFNWMVNAVGVTSPGDQYNTAGDRVSLPVTANGTYTYVITGLPKGLTYDSDSGLISGTIAPTAGSDTPYAVTVTATDGVNSGGAGFNWYVAVPVLTDRSDVEGTDVGFQAPAPTDAGPAYSASNLPNGVGIDSGAGWISGTLATGDAANGPYAVVVTTTYADGTSSSQSFNWTVNPVVTTPPVLTNAGSITGMVGVAVNVDLSTPSSPANPLTYSDDGLPDGLYLDADTGLVSGTPAEDAIENTSVTETVTDSFGNNASRTLDWNVTDSVLTVQGNALNAAEGAGAIFTVATFFDPDMNRQATDYTATISWGDGQTSEGWVDAVDGATGSYTVSGDYAYLHPGTYPVQVTITDPTDNATTVTDTATVTASTLTATGGFSEGEVLGQSPIMTLAVFSDTSTYATAGSFTAAINWGDGTSSYGTVDGEDGQFRVEGNHTYALEGTYAPTVKITASDNATATTTSTVTVGDVYANVAQNLNIASFTDNSLTGAPSTYTAAINWGDGTTTAGVVTGSQGSISVTAPAAHTYAAVASYGVSATVTDAAGDAAVAYETIQAVTAPATGYDGDVATTPGVASDADDALAVDPGGHDDNGDINDLLQTQTFSTAGVFALQNPIFGAGDVLVGAAIGQAQVRDNPKWSGPDVVPGNSDYAFQFSFRPISFDDFNFKCQITAPGAANQEITPEFRGPVGVKEVSEIDFNLQFSNQPATIKVTLNNYLKGVKSAFSFTVYVVQVLVANPDEGKPFYPTPVWPAGPVTGWEHYGLTVTIGNLTVPNQDVHGLSIKTLQNSIQGQIPAIQHSAKITLNGPTFDGKPNYGVGDIHVGFHQVAYIGEDRALNNTNLLKASVENQHYLDSRDPQGWYPMPDGSYVNGKAGSFDIGSNDSPEFTPIINYESPNFNATKVEEDVSFVLSVAAATADTANVADYGSASSHLFREAVATWSVNADGAITLAGTGAAQIATWTPGKSAGVHINMDNGWSLNIAKPVDLLTTGPRGNVAINKKTLSYFSLP